MIEIAHLDESDDDEDGRPRASSTSTRPLAETLLQTEEDRLMIHKRISAQIRRRIQDNYPGSVLYERENLLTCIICLSKDPSAARLQTSLLDLPPPILPHP